MAHFWTSSQRDNLSISILGQHDMPHRIGFMTAQWALSRPSLRCLQTVSLVQRVATVPRLLALRRANTLLPRQDPRCMSSAQKLKASPPPASSPQPNVASKGRAPAGVKYGKLVRPLYFSARLDN